MRKLRIALTKGRLEDKTISALEKASLNVDDIKNKGRRLILSLPDIDAEVVLAKAVDVLTYVEKGVCDIGIVGKDTILDHGGAFYEMADLGFGKCRFILAALDDKDFFARWKTLKIATKYTEITRNYFNKKGLDVEIIKIEGSVELAPLLGLSDGIVDITETGNTLKENGLKIIDEICDISARLIVNTAAIKMRNKEILSFIELLNKGL